MAAQQSPPSGAVADLPVAATVVGSFASVFGRLGLVAQAAKGAFAMVLAAALALVFLPDNTITQFFLILVGQAASCHFAVNWCRVMLMGPQGLPARSLSWEEVHWRFFGYGLLVAVIMLVMTLPLTAIGSVLAGVLGLMQSPQQIGPALLFNLCLIFGGMLYVLARLGFIFPAIAAGESYSFGLSWQHTKGQSLRLTATLAAVLLPVTVAQLMVSEFLLQALFDKSMMDMLPQLPTAEEGVPADAPPGAADAPAEAASKAGIIVFNLLSAVVNFLSFAVLFSLLCLAFRTLTGWVPASPANLPVAPGGEVDEDQSNDSDADR